MEVFRKIDIFRKIKTGSACIWEDDIHALFYLESLLNSSGDTPYRSENTFANLP